MHVIQEFKFTTCNNMGHLKAHKQLSIGKVPVSGECVHAFQQGVYHKGELTPQVSGGGHAIEKNWRRPGNKVRNEFSNTYGFLPTQIMISAVI